MMMLPKSEKQQPIRANVIKSAIDELEYLGYTFNELVVKYLNSHGVVFDNKHYYSLEQIERLLVNLFGITVTPILIERLSLTKSLLSHTQRLAQHKVT